MTTEAMDGLRDPDAILNPFTEMMNGLDLHGWVQGKLGSEDEGFCIAGVYGHIAMLAPEQFNTPECRREMADIFAEVLPQGHTIFGSNDRIFKDDLDVRECLKHAAQIWDERHTGADS